MNDRASVNNSAMRTLKIIYPNVVDIGCFSHTHDHLGENFNTLVLDQFVKTWINLFSRSPMVKLAWREKTGLQNPYILSHKMMVKVGSTKGSSIVFCRC